MAANATRPTPAKFPADIARDFLSKNANAFQFYQGKYEGGKFNHYSTLDEFSQKDLEEIYLSLKHFKYIA